MVLRVGFPQQFDRMIEDFMTSEPSHWNANTPSVDIMEDEKQYTILAELPGVKKEDSKISVENNLLTLSAEKKLYEIPQDAKILLNEVRTRKFERSIRLPEDADSSKISAELKNGILSITVMKKEVVRPKTVEIK